MKKNKKGLIHSLILFAFFSALIVTTITQVKPLSGFEGFIIIWLWVFQTIGVLGIVTYLKTPKPSYDWSDLKEQKVFKIISFIDNSFDGEFVEIKPDHSGFIVVDVENFGKTLIQFPAKLSLWQHKSPEVGKNYMRIADNFFPVLSVKK